MPLLQTVSQLQTMSGIELALARVEAQFASEIIGRPPLCFMAHNAFVEQAVGGLQRWS